MRNKFLNTLRNQDLFLLMFLFSNQLLEWNNNCLNMCFCFFFFQVTHLKHHAFRNGILIFDNSFPCSKQCVPKAPYHCPVRCWIVRRLDGELIRARGSQNHRGIGCVAHFRPLNAGSNVEKATSTFVPQRESMR